MRTLILISMLLFALPAAGATELPEPPPGWRVEAVAEAPRLRHPTVVCAAPDGRVFVAEDPMDISAPAAHLRHGRVLCFHPGGSVTTFADDLHAVFGLQYLDGRLYVLHNPKFSVFTDDRGVGTNRVDLIESTHPNPWALDWNDHVPANFRLAMDGYFYVAVGDKGLYGATGGDGRRVDLRGGGIVRVRPDGTGLEVVSTGVRNILDVAMTAEDEMFTYDNTDEHDWMGRLTHMVDGGFYGYPYHFLPRRRPYTLWMMADFGGGAATGAFCYTADALPGEYHGNLFLADFGKRQVLRVRVAREGGTFKVTGREDFFRDPPGDFRPVGITPTADGTGFYLCDWQHLDTKENVSVGRLLKVTYTGAMRPTPQPQWYVAAASGRPHGATAAQLLDGLRHPSRDVRAVAQRRLTEIGGATVKPLAELLADDSAPPPARWHALWALHAIGGPGAEVALASALDAADISVRRQAIRAAALRGERGALPRLVKHLADPDASVRFAAATACGRVGDASAVPHLLAALKQDDLFARYAAFTALNRIGRRDPATWSAIISGLRSDDARVREGAAFALRETYDPALVTALAAMTTARGAPTDARRHAVALLAAVSRREPPWKGEWWAYHPALGPPPEKTEAWEGTERCLRAVRDALADPEGGVRLAALEAVATTRDLDAAPAARALLSTERDPTIRAAALAAAGTLKDREAAPHVAAALQDDSTDAAVVLAAIDAAGRIGGEQLVESLHKLLAKRTRPPVVVRAALAALGACGSAGSVHVVAPFARAEDGETRGAALRALEAIGGDAAVSALVPLLADPSVDVRKSAIASLGRLRATAAVPELLKAYADDATRPEALAALCATADERAVDVYLEALSGKNADARDRARGAIETIRDAARPLIEGKVAALPDQAVAQLQRAYKDNAAAQGGPIFSRVVRAREPAEYLAAVLRPGAGEAQRGRAIFFDATGAACSKCHAVGGQGGRIGPDLSTIGAQQTRQALAENILLPSKTVREGYQLIIVRKRGGGEVIAGTLKAETPSELTLLDNDGKLQQVRKADIEKRNNSSLSPMPEGLHVGLTPEQFADLVTYLESLKDAAAQPAPEE